jgi:homoserine/homoserine lactone efflux protein
VSFEHWLLFAGTEFVAYLVPGPAVVVVLSTALGRGNRAAISTGFGVLLAEVMFFLASATGIGLLLIRLHSVFQIIRWAGAGYLIWLGIETFRASGEPFPGPREGGRPADVRRTVGRGFVTNAANPKALLFYVAILPQFIDTSMPMATQLLLLGVTSLCVGAAVFGLYIAAADLLGSRLRSPGFARHTGRATGVLLVGAGAGVAMMETD